MKVPVIVAVAVAHILFASAAGCLGPQHHSEATPIVGSFGSCRDVRHGGHDVGRGRINVVDVDRGLLRSKRNKHNELDCSYNQRKHKIYR